jgi:hypothetical protein
MNAKLKISVNKNETKEGVKVQFAFPKVLMGDEKDAWIKKLQKKLSSGLLKYDLTVNKDTDIPKTLGNVIGFTIPIADIKGLISKAYKEGTTGGDEMPPETPEAPVAPAPESEPLQEAKSKSQYKDKIKYHEDKVKYHKEKIEDLKKLMAKNK